MSQFERDIHLAIQQSLEEERKKQEALNQNQINTTPGNVNPTPQQGSETQTSKKYYKK